MYLIIFSKIINILIFIAVEFLVSHLALSSIRKEPIIERIRYSEYRYLRYIENMLIYMSKIYIKNVNIDIYI